MPTFVIGADTPLGREVAGALAEAGGELRVFVTDPSHGDTLRASGAKVATGDVSDQSHVAAAARGAHTAVLVLEAVHDGREMAFGSPSEIPSIWLEAVSESEVRRLIVVGEAAIPPGMAGETAVVVTRGRPPADVASEVASLDAAARIVLDQHQREWES